MIYQLGQVSNRDTQVLYFYRILRHNANNLGELYRYEDPETLVLEKPIEVTLDDVRMLEYHLDIPERTNRIPYIEFLSEDESILQKISELTELEVKSDELIIRGTLEGEVESVQVAIYWVPSLAYIEKMQTDIESVLGDLRNKANTLSGLIDGIGGNADYVVNLEGLVPNLVDIGSDNIGLIYDDSHYRLSGSLSSQLLISPGQSVISSLLKSQTGTLTVRDLSRDSKVYQGFYGGCLALSGTYTSLILKDITSTVFLNNIIADLVLIENCSAVIFRESLDVEGSSANVTRLEVRNSYLTIYQDISIRSLWCYRRSTVVLKKGIIGEIGFVEAGSSLVIDHPADDNKINLIKTTRLQGLFYASNPTEKYPYLEEIYLADKPISFQRSQVDDPIPVSKAIVDIHLQGNISGSPQSGPSGRIYSPFTNWYWSGDSRTVGLINTTHTDGQGFGGKGLSTLIDQKNNIVAGAQNHNLALWWGVNGLENGYAPVYQEIADSLGNNGMTFVCTVGRVFDTNSGGTLGDEGGYGSITIVEYNEKIKAWNENLKSELSSSNNIHILDVWKFIEDCLGTYTELELAAGKGNGLHYSGKLNQLIYDWVCEQITNSKSIQVDPHYSPFPEYIGKDLSDAYMGPLPNIQNIENNIGLGIMYGISLSEYGNNPVGWLYARLFRTYLMLGWYIKFSTNLTEEGRALLNPKTNAWSFGGFYSESSLLRKVKSNGTQAGLENFYYLVKLGGVMTGYEEGMDDLDKMRLIAGGAPTGNNSLTGCPQDGQFHENFFARGLVDARWIYDSTSSWIYPIGTGRMTYYSDKSVENPRQLNPNI